MRELARRHLLAICCILGPILFAALGTEATTRWMLPEQIGNLRQSFVFLPDAASNPAGGVGQPDVKLLFPARDISGRIRYAAISALLCLVSVGAFVFGAVVVAHCHGPRALAIAFVLVLPAPIAFGFSEPAFERARPLVVESILKAADLNGSYSPMAVKDWSTPKTIIWLVRFNTVVALLGVGMLLMALYVTSIRACAAALTLQDLRKRREIARWVLGLGSAILVVAVIASEILVDWPPSLLASSQQLALKPIADAINLLLGVIGTIALLAAFAPAIAAFTLDVRRYRVYTPVRGGPAGDELGFAPVSSVTGLIVAFAPLLASVLKLLL